jgi:DNA repair exonuclease SbcCD ATPase subunit
MLSILSIDSEADFSDSGRADQHKIMETELYKKFEEAFNMTLRNNLGILLLSGVPTLIKSIQIACFEVQKKKVEREYVMRKKLEKAKIEKDQLEDQLRKEMGGIARRCNDLAMESQTTKGGKDIEKDALSKQINAVEAEKRELTRQTIDAAEATEELTKQLNYLSKSRKELERALGLELELAEKDRDALQKVLAEREKLQKQKMENTELENMIEHVAQVASKEMKALQAEAVELKKFEDHIKQLRNENEEAQKDLELEKKHIKENTEALQTKKILLMESWKEMEKQFQEEIDELQGKVQHAIMVHEEEMENIITSWVMTYLKGVDAHGDRTKSMLVGRDETVKNMGSTGPESNGEFPLDIDSIVRERVEAELKKKMATERTDFVEEIRHLRKEMKTSQDTNGATKRFMNLG